MKAKEIQFFFITGFILTALSTNAQHTTKLLTFGPEVDIPISGNVAGLHAFGGNVSYSIPGKKRTAAIFGFSFLKQQYTYFRFPAGGTYTTYKGYNTVYKITGGVLMKLGGNWYNLIEGGIYLQQNNPDYTIIRPIIVVGPMLLLPAGKNKIRLGLNTSYNTGLFATLSAAYGLKL